MGTLGDMEGQQRPKVGKEWNGILLHPCIVYNCFRNSIYQLKGVSGLTYTAYERLASTQMDSEAAAIFLRKAGYQVYGES